MVNIDHYTTGRAAGNQIPPHVKIIKLKEYLERFYNIPKQYNAAQKELRDIVRRVDAGEPVFMSELGTLQGKDRRTLARAGIEAGTGEDKGLYRFID